MLIDRTDKKVLASTDNKRAERKALIILLALSINLVYILLLYLTTQLCY